MQSKELNEHICRSLTILIESSDELRDLDQALGDGDLGITITAGSLAVIAALEELPDDHHADGDRTHVREGLRKRQPVDDGGASRRCAPVWLSRMGGRKRHRRRRSRSIYQSRGRQHRATRQEPR